MNPQDEALSVTEADRNAADNLAVEWPKLSRGISRIGLERAFARHRLSHSTPGDTSALHKRLSDSIDLARKLTQAEPDRVEMDFAFAVQLCKALATPGDAEVRKDAADLLERYAAYVRTVKADDLELHPYLPEIERVAQALAQPGAPQRTIARFAADLENADFANVASALNQLMCCNGHMCGCQGYTVGQYLAYELRSALAIPSGRAQAPKGWQLVPVELTQAMLDATCCDEADDKQMRETWKALLYAAPPAQDQGDEA